MTYHWRAMPIDHGAGYGVALELQGVGPRGLTKRNAVRISGRDRLTEAVRTLSEWADGWAGRFDELRPGHPQT